MPEIWPRVLPHHIVENPLRSAECKVFTRLQKTLSGDYTVFYSRPWLGLTRYGEEIDGECDFVVAHPDKGILFIEVKGGRIHYSPSEDKWTSINRNDIRLSIKDPVLQAMRSKHQLLKKFSGYSGWPQEKIHAAHGVVFPDCEVPDHSLRPDAPRRLFCDASQLESGLEGWITERLTPPISMDGPDPAGMKILEECLVMPFHLKRPLMFDIEDNEEIFLTLSTNQFLILDTIRNIPRAVVMGAAGTGKTVLAVEEAIRCSQNDYATLLLCFNTPLAEWLKCKYGHYKNLNIFTFHAFCGYMAAKAGEAPTLSNQKTLYDRQLPEALERSAGVLPHLRYEAIIIDEGQDFQPHWWSAIEAVLKNRKSKLRIFMDANQSVYGVPSIPASIECVDIPLDKNFRNAKPIFAEVSRFYEGPLVISAGPDGPPFELVQGCPNPEEKLATLVRGLIDVEKVKPSQIGVVVHDKAPELVNFLSGQLPDMRFRRCEGIPAKNTVTVDTVRRFKGLEFHIIIVMGTQALLMDPMLSYIAYSRAQTKLIVISCADFHHQPAR